MEVMVAVQSDTLLHALRVQLKRPLDGPPGAGRALQASKMERTS
jgi:hypothetical protein